MTIKDGLPGWIPQSVVTLSVLVVIFLAGMDVARFFELMQEAGVAIVGLIPVSLSPWLAYKYGIRREEMKNGVDLDEEGILD